MKARVAWIGGGLAVIGFAVLLGITFHSIRSTAEADFLRELQAANRRDQSAKGSAQAAPNFKPIQRQAAKPIVDGPNVVSAGESSALVADGDSVIGIVVDGEARAYPINMMAKPQHELLNDTLGGRQIAVTWCGLCESGIVFDRRLDDQTLSFFLPGSVWEGNMLMADSKTKSLWSQALGKAMEGPYKGRKLTVLPSTVTDWGAWKSTHPETTLLGLSKISNEYVQNFSYDATKTGPDQFMLVLNLDSGARGWPLKSLTADVAINDAIGDTPVVVLYDDRHFTAFVYYRRLEDQALEFRHEDGKIVDAQTHSVWDAATGQATEGPLQGRQLERAPGFMILRDKWLNLHPDTSLWTPENPEHQAAS